MARYETLREDELASDRKQVVVEQVSHSFAGQMLAVDEMSFTVGAGEFVVIVGPSGCGKTTILNIIAGLMRQQTGEVIVDGQAPRAGRHDVAYMFAQDALLPWRKVIDNVLFGVEIQTGSRRPSREVRENAESLLSMVGLSGFGDAYPRQLSHGMRQRVALARTFLMPSPILLMDEPFGALDAHTKLMLEQGLLRLWDRDKRTVLFITHDLAEAICLADRVLICTARPGKIKSEIEIDLPRPRDINQLQHDPKYHELYQKIWEDMSLEMQM
ncbi:MAG: ABC transporter ATP-binding protein [Rhizobiales bacterium]|nr:ABC transporter ATP-binding protein [Hyphomicrobiales bacterium]HVT28728.1 ABC transporter ATP-binding protein [Lacipirellulaceae bacterium]